MCGIIAVVPAQIPPRAPDLSALAAALEALRVPAPTAQDTHERALRHTDSTIATVNDMLSGANAERSLLGSTELLPRLDAVASRLEQFRGEAEQQLDALAMALDPTEVETIQRLLVRIADRLWALRHDRLDRIRALREFLGSSPESAAIAPISAVTGYSAIETALRGIDRLEVRGRDSAGIHVWVGGPGLGRMIRRAQGDVADRRDPLLAGGAVEVTSSGVCFTYKTAAVTGGLGDNVRALRAAIAADGLLARAVHVPGVRVSVLGHTRWASVGRISEPNACPVHNGIAGTIDEKRPYTVAALNGDIDNHTRLRISEDVGTQDEITTDAKLIPVMLARAVENTKDLDDLVRAFARTVGSFDGSFAIAAQSEQDPEALLLAVRGSGQGLYVGCAYGTWVVASEPYGLVSETDRYLRVDGGRQAEATAPGTLVVLRRDGTGEASGLTRYHGDGTPFPIDATEFTRTEITTRDIALGGFPHFLLKEITQASTSVATTLRGRIVTGGQQRRVRLGARVLPESVAAALRSGDIRRLILVGQGTAAAACDGIAATARSFLGGPLSITSMPATEFSAWHIEPDMSDCLLVAVSQSGTTTDTNRAVDMAREAGAAVISIVNRRDSDLVTKAHGVLYTADGRDIEMAVASTKAFYSQITAGILLVLQLRGMFVPADADPEAEELIAALERLPEHIDQVVGDREPFRETATALATRNRHWAVVGSGPNQVAAAEVRIKLSELGYKTVAADATENKKHIDLSAEAMIVVCAAGAGGANADDLDKEVAIFAAHDNTPVVIATEGHDRFHGIEHVLVVPETHPALAWLLSVAAGHLFAYECVTAIDQAATPLRRALGLLNDTTSSDGEAIPAIRPHIREFLARVGAGTLDGCLSPRHVMRLTALNGAFPSGGIDELESTLTALVDELTRPIDTVRHQAKTVTVGTTRTTGTTPA